MTDHLDDLPAAVRPAAGTGTGAGQQVPPAPAPGPVPPITLVVPGVPAPQGSKTRMPNGALVEAGSTTGRVKVAEWRRAVADAARAHVLTHTADGWPLTGPVGLTVAFRFAPTKSAPHRRHHVVKPDLDKLVRATTDALVAGGLLRDDALVADLAATKRYCRLGEHPGAVIEITDRSEAEVQLQLHLKLQARAARKAAS